LERIITSYSWYLGNKLGWAKLIVLQGGESCWKVVGDEDDAEWAKESSLPTWMDVWVGASFSRNLSFGEDFK
jgi:hypothetical protein